LSIPSLKAKVSDPGTSKSASVVAYMRVGGGGRRREEGGGEGRRRELE